MSDALESWLEQDQADIDLKSHLAAHERGYENGFREGIKKGYSEALTRFYKSATMKTKNDYLQILSDEIEDLRS